MQKVAQNGSIVSTSVNSIKFEWGITLCVCLCKIGRLKVFFSSFLLRYFIGVVRRVWNSWVPIRPRLMRFILQRWKRTSEGLWITRSTRKWNNPKFYDSKFVLFIHMSSLQYTVSHALWEWIINCDRTALPL